MFKNRKKMDTQYIIAIRWKKDYDDIKNRSIIFDNLSKMIKKGYKIEKPQLTTVDDINIIIYAHGNKEDIDNTIKHIQNIDGVEKAEYQPLIPA